MIKPSAFFHVYMQLSQAFSITVPSQITIPNVMRQVEGGVPRQGRHSRKWEERENGLN